MPEYFGSVEQISFMVWRTKDSTLFAILPNSSAEKKGDMWHIDQMRNSMGKRNEKKEQERRDVECIST